MQVFSQGRLRCHLHPSPVSPSILRNRHGY
uniref:Uncharacterized protein n=1 Tax=Arundo donax TaxID=35708 RepID=A0A0A9GUC4_ARUDO